MDQRSANSAFESLIYSISSHPTDRGLMREAARRWGISVFRPIADLLYSNVDLSYGGASSPGADATGDRQMSLSRDLSLGKFPLMGSLPADVPGSLQRDAAYYLAHYRARGTMKNRMCHVREIIRQCVTYNARPFPMSEGTAIAIVTTLATRGLASKSIAGMRDTISAMHKLAEKPDPTQGMAFSRVMRGIERTLGNASPNRKIALTRAEAAAIRNLARRDGRYDFATMVSVGFEGALRSEELLDLRIPEVLIRRDRWQLLIGRSKCDQTAHGEFVDLKPGDASLFDPRKDLASWLHRLARNSGYVFPVMEGAVVRPQRRNVRAFARTLKGYAAIIGLDPATVGTHSLRAGWATDAIDSGLSESVVAAHLRHKSLDLLTIYYRPRHLPPNFAASVDPGKLF